MEQDSERTALETTASLIQRIQNGEAAAQERLIKRYLPALQRWARGRMPRRARSMTDTDDLVQVTLLKALKKLKEFEPRHKGAFLAYLRRILQNEIRDEIRRATRRPEMQSLPENLDRDQPSPLERAIGREKMEAYERALAQLEPQQQEAIILRLELGFTHSQVAEALGSPSANAARMFVSRALVRLTEVLDVH